MVDFRGSQVGSSTTRRARRRVTAAGCVVSVFRFPSSLLGTRPAAVEMHAIDLRADPPHQHVARVVVGEAEDIEQRCALTKEAATVGRRADLSPLAVQVTSSNVSIPEALRIWQAATPAEREAIRAALARKIIHDPRLTPDQKDGLPTRAGKCGS